MAAFCERALIRPRLSQNAQAKDASAITPSGTPTPAPIAVSRDDDPDPELELELESELDVVSVGHEELDEFVELTARAARPGMAVPIGTETVFIGHVTVPLSHDAWPQQWVVLFPA